MVTRRRVVFVGAAGALGLAACQLILGVEDRGHSDPLAGDAGGADAAEARDACPHALPPARPTQDDVGPRSGVPEQWFVLKQVLIDNPAVSRFGFDLDETCTCYGAGSACVPRDPKTVACDDRSGRDNTSLALFHMFALLANKRDGDGGIIPADDQITVELGRGTLNALMRVRFYNGNENDQDVEFAAYMSAGYYPPLDGGVDAAADAPSPPEWRANEAWTYDPRSVIPPDNPPLPEVDYPKFVARGYVRDGVMVAYLPVLEVGFGAFFVTLNDAWFTATVRFTLDAPTYELRDARIAGRWRVADMLRAIGTVRDPAILNPPPGTKASLCPGSPSFPTVKQSICKLADLTTKRAADGTGATCDALSTVVGLTLSPARIGARRSSILDERLCADASDLEFECE